VRRIIGYLLNGLYLAALLVLAPAIAWTSFRTGKYRAGWQAKLFGRVPRRQGNRDCFWLHAVSVGEVNLLATTIREIRSRRPNVDIVISTTTNTGYALAVRKYGSDHQVFYCPLDFTWAVDTAMCRIRPQWLVLAELELWPNLIAAAKCRGVRVAIINGRLSENSFRGYRRLRWLVSHSLQQVDLIAAQDETTANRFCKLGANRQTTAITGSLKYDGADTNRENRHTVAFRQLAAGFFGSERSLVWLAGSTQEPEEKMAVDVFRRLASEHPELRLIIVPRHAERFDEVAKLLDASEIPWERRSKLSEAKPLSHAARCLLVDTIGELGGWWGPADIGFVGGSFGDRGGQNMIEPAAYGVATCFGPNTRNFRDIVAALLRVDGARVVEDEQALETFVRRCLADHDFRGAVGQRAQALVAAQLGATARTVDLLLGESVARQAAA
jgi:3-deoxy-D-manno-octulosonic-acid transferase